jgi:hypothetical protein
MYIFLFENSPSKNHPISLTERYAQKIENISSGQVCARNSNIQSTIFTNTFYNFKDYQNCTNPKDECNLKLKTHQCMFFKLHEKTYYLTISRQRGGDYKPIFTSPSAQ